MPILERKIAHKMTILCSHITYPEFVLPLHKHAEYELMISGMGECLFVHAGFFTMLAISGFSRLSASRYRLLIGGAGKGALSLLFLYQRDARRELQCHILSASWFRTDAWWSGNANLSCGRFWLSLSLASTYKNEKSVAMTRPWRRLKRLWAKNLITADSALLPCVAHGFLVEISLRSIYHLITKLIQLFFMRKAKNLERLVPKCGMCNFVKNGYRTRYFKLRLYALHDFRITWNVGWVTINSFIKMVENILLMV